MWCFNLTGGISHCSWSCEWQEHFLQTGKVLLSLASVSSHKWDDSSSAEYSIGFSGVYPLCSLLCSGFVLQTPATLILCPSALVSSLQSIHWVISEFLPLVPWPGNAPKAVSVALKGLLCFLFLCPSLSDVYGLEKSFVSYVLPVFCLIQV